MNGIIITPTHIIVSINIHKIKYKYTYSGIKSVKVQDM